MEHGTGAPIGFSKFIDMMNQEQAKDLVRKINTFMRDFKQRPNDPDQDSRHVQDFYVHMEATMARHPLFVNCTTDDLDASMEALEKYLMTKLYDRTFAATPEEVERDQILLVRMSALQFVQPEHLEIPPSLMDEASLSVAVTELNKINGYKGPRDKLVCLLNCCRVINNILTTNAKAEGIGADDFTPLLIYVVIKAQTAHLASNLVYIERYRVASKLASEAQYYFIQLCSAATFIEMVNAGSLKVNPDEFIANMLAAGALTDDQLALMQSQSGSPAHPASRGAAAASGAMWPAEPQNGAAAAGVSARDSLTMQALPALGGSQQQQEFPAPFVQPPPPSGQSQPAAAVKPLTKSFLPPMSVAELEAQGAALLAASSSSSSSRAEAANSSSSSSSTGVARLSARYPFAFTSLDQMTVGEVGQLLVAYKELVLKYECLAAALEWHEANPSGKGPLTEAAASSSSRRAAPAAAPLGSAPLQAPPLPPVASAAAVGQPGQQWEAESATAAPAAATNPARASTTPALAASVSGAGMAVQNPNQAAAAAPPPPVASGPVVQHFGAWPEDWRSTAAAVPADHSPPASTSETGRGTVLETSNPGAAGGATEDHAAAAERVEGGGAPVDDLLQSLLGGDDDKAAATGIGSSAGGEGGAGSGGLHPESVGGAAASGNGVQPATVDLMGLLEGAPSGPHDPDAAAAEGSALSLFEGMDVEKAATGGAAAVVAAALGPPSLLD